MPRRYGTRPRAAGLRRVQGLRLTSLMDILVCLLLFLIKAFAIEGEVVTPPPGVVLPASSAEDHPTASLVIAISNDTILLGDETIATVEETASSNDLVIPALDERLRAESEQRDALAQLQGEEREGSRLVTIQGDRNIEYRVLEKVMYTLDRNGFGHIALAVLKNT